MRNILKIKINLISLVRIFVLLMLLTTQADFLRIILMHSTILEIVPKLSSYFSIILFIWPIIALHFSEKLLKLSAVFGLIVGFIVGILPCYFFDLYYQNSIDSVSIKRDRNMKWST